MMQLLVTCPFGLSSLLNTELKRLNIKSSQTLDTAVIVETDLVGLYQINLRSRIANKVYIILEQKEMLTFDQLFDSVSAIDRKSYLPSATISLQVTTKNSQLNSQRTIQSVAHKAVLNALTSCIKTPSASPCPSRSLYGTGSSQGETQDEKNYAIYVSPGEGRRRNQNEVKRTEEGFQPQFEIFIHLEHNQAKICLNTSGPSLHQRGRRKQTGPAPLKENLAAAMVLLSGRKFSAPLIDPCCGSGTILIEAAMIAKNIAPGLQRAFAFQSFQNFDSQLRNTLITQAREKIFDKSYTLVGRDIDPHVLQIAQKNAEIAGVSDCISREQQDIQTGTILFSSEFWLLSNPPYGKRLSESEDLFPLYKKLVSYLREGYGGIIIPLMHAPNEAAGKGDEGGSIQKEFPQKYFSHKQLYNGADKVDFYRKKL